MSLTIKIGKYKKTNSWTMPIGLLSAECNISMKNKTLEQIAKKLAKQFRIKKGKIELSSIQFTYELPSPKKQGKLDV